MACCISLLLELSLTAELDNGSTPLLSDELSADCPTSFADVESLSQLAQKNPVRANAILFQCL
jgi:hypothetical protein